MLEVYVYWVLFYCPRWSTVSHPTECTVEVDYEVDSKESLDNFRNKIATHFGEDHIVILNFKLLKKA